jgi:hypothetical protein
LLSMLKVVMYSSCQRGCHGKADGKKKVMGKQKTNEKRSDSFSTRERSLKRMSANLMRSNDSGTHMSNKIRKRVIKVRVVVFYLFIQSCYTDALYNRGRAVV